MNVSLLLPHNTASFHLHANVRIAIYANACECVCAYLCGKIREKGNPTPPQGTWGLVGWSIMIPAPCSTLQHLFDTTGLICDFHLLAIATLCRFISNRWQKSTNRKKSSLACSFIRRIYVLLYLLFLFLFSYQRKCISIPPILLNHLHFHHTTTAVPIFLLFRAAWIRLQHMIQWVVHIIH